MYWDVWHKTTKRILSCFYYLLTQRSLLKPWHITLSCVCMSLWVFLKCCFALPGVHRDLDSLVYCTIYRLGALFYLFNYGKEKNYVLTANAEL